MCTRANHPQDKNNTTASSSTLRVDEGCCLDFTHPCNVPPFPITPHPTVEDGKSSLRPTWFKTEATRDKHDKEHKWTKEYGKGGLFWSYGGSGTFLSAGLLDKVHEEEQQQGAQQGQKQAEQGGGGSSSSGMGGWELCAEMFGIGYDTDIQVYIRNVLSYFHIPVFLPTASGIV